MMSSGSIKKKNMGSGWMSSGISRYNAIFESVAEDRKVRGRSFNNDLLDFYNKQHEKREDAREKRRVWDEKPGAHSDFPCRRQTSAYEEV